MSRINTEDKIKILAEDKMKLEPKAIELLVCMAKTAKIHNGIVYQYKDKETEKKTETIETFRDKIFAGDAQACMRCLTLLEEKELIKCEGLYYYVLALDSDHFAYLRCKIFKETTRKYTRSPIEGQKDIDELINKRITSYGEKLSTEFKSTIKSIKDKAQSKSVPSGIKVGNFNLLGIAIPRNIGRYLTGSNGRKDNEDVTGKKETSRPKESISTLLRNSLIELNREGRRVLMGLIALVDRDGVIYNYKGSVVLKKLQEIFGKVVKKDKNGETKEVEAISKTTFYDWINKFKEMGLISIVAKEKNNKVIAENLRIEGYDDGFKEGYVMIPFLVFQNSFKAQSTASMKITLDKLFQWNNGENGTEGEEINPMKPVKMTIFPDSQATVDTRKKYEKTLSWLKKRCKSEVIDTILGENGLECLGQFFIIDISKAKSGILTFYVKPEYAILKKQCKDNKNEIKRLSIDMLERYPAKTAYIKGELENINNRLPEGEKFDYTEDDLQEIVSTLKDLSNREIQRLIDDLVIDIETRKKNNWKGIDSIMAYLKWLYKRYTKGTRVVAESRVGETIKHMFDDIDIDLESEEYSPCDDGVDSYGYNYVQDITA